MNTLFTTTPIVGTLLTPQIIKQITAAVRRYMPIAGTGIKITQTAGGSIIAAIQQGAPQRKETDRPLPFEVRYDATLDDGAGGWKIFLPTEHLVQYDGAYLDPIGGVTAILDANGDATGWYSFDALTLQDSHVWLAVTQSGPTFSASFESAQVTAAKENICIAELEYTAATASAPATISINQSAVGALVITSARDDALEPDDISTEAITTPSGQTAGADEGKLQIKGWKTGTPASSTSLASDINWEYTTEALVARDLTDGTLRYKPIGDLATLLGSQVSKANQKILTGLSWSTTNHTLVISSATVNIDHGVITAWQNNNDETIGTTSINSIIN